MNRGLIILVNTVLGFAAAVLYLGSEQEYLALKNHIVHSFLVRLFPFWATGVLFALILVSINFILSTQNIVSATRQQLSRLLLFAIVATTVCTLAGTAIFFCQ